MSQHTPQGWTDQSQTQPISVTGGHDQPQPEAPAAAPETAPEAANQGAPHTATARTEPTDGSSLRTVLHVLAAVLVVAGISLPLDGGDVLWVNSATWAAFATLAAIAQVAAVGSRGSMSGHAWWVGAVGAAALVLFWTLLMLPVISTNMAFLVTLGTAASVTAVLTNPDRRV